MLLLEQSGFEDLDLLVDLGLLDLKIGDVVLEDEVLLLELLDDLFLPFEVLAELGDLLLELLDFLKDLGAGIVHGFRGIFELLFDHLEAGLEAILLVYHESDVLAALFDHVLFLGGGEGVREVTLAGELRLDELAVFRAQVLENFSDPLFLGVLRVGAQLLLRLEVSVFLGEFFLLFLELPPFAFQRLLRLLLECLDVYAFNCFSHSA